MKLRTWGPVVVWMAVIFFLSAQSQLPTPAQRWLDILLEKTAHALEFAILAALVRRALGSAESRPRRTFGWAILIAWLYALSDEYHQSFVPGRAADWSDILFDWLGAVLGVWLWQFTRTARQGSILAKNG